MNKIMLMVSVAAVMDTLLEMGGPCPKSILKMALESKFEEFKRLDVFLNFCNTLSRIGWVDVTSETLCLTATGVVKANEMAAIQAAQA